MTHRCPQTYLRLHAAIATAALLIGMVDIPADPAVNWDFSLGESAIVPNHAEVPIYYWYPDGHIAVLPEDDGQWVMYWSEAFNYRTIGPTQFPEDQHTLDPGDMIFGDRGNWEGYDNGGKWLMSVFRMSGDSLIGFYHAEDHWYPHTVCSDCMGWKSIGVCYSYDNGFSWEDGGQTITSHIPRPESPEHGGIGDICVVRDTVNTGWICFYQNDYICAAASSDPLGRPGTWHKYYEGSFSEPGLGGQNTFLPGLDTHPGTSPSVHYNTYLEKWVIVWGGWAWVPFDIFISASVDLIHWETPRSVVSSVDGGFAWYPTIIGETNVKAGKEARLYYADMESDFSQRDFIGRTITFSRDDSQAAIPVEISRGNEWREPFSVKHAASGRASIRTFAQGEHSVEIWTMAGELIQTFRGTGTETYAWRPASSGVYCCRFSSGNILSVRQLVIGGR